MNFTRSLMILLMLSMLVPVSTQAKGKKSKSLTWKRYHAACGLENSDRLDNFEQFKGRPVTWHGKVKEIRGESALSSDATFGTRVVRIKMDPSDSLKADVKLRIPKDKDSLLNKLTTGQEIIFKGKIMYLGNAVQDHIVEVTKFGKYKPKAKKKKKKKKAN